MKNFLILLTAIFVTVLLSACAASGPESGTKIKCPACGEDFLYEAPTDDG